MIILQKNKTPQFHMLSISLYIKGCSGFGFCHSITSVTWLPQHLCYECEQDVSEGVFIIMHTWYIPPQCSSCNVSLTPFLFLFFLISLKWSYGRSIYSVTDYKCDVWTSAANNCSLCSISSLLINSASWGIPILLIVTHYIYTMVTCSCCSNISSWSTNCKYYTTL